MSAHDPAPVRYSGTIHDGSYGGITTPDEWVRATDHDAAISALTQERDRAREEAGRLREALQRIVEDGDYTAPEGMKQIARAALAPQVQQV